MPLRKNLQRCASQLTLFGMTQCDEGNSAVRCMTTDMKTFIIIFGLVINISFGVKGQNGDSYLCGNGKFAIDLQKATQTADSLVKIGKLNEAITVLLPFALNTQFGENSASSYSAKLIKRTFTKQEIEKELKEALASIKVKKQTGPYGETETLQMVIFGNEIVLPDMYYWLGAPINKSTVSRQEIDATTSITKTRQKLESSLLYSELRL